MNDIPNLYSPPPPFSDPSTADLPEPHRQNSSTISPGATEAEIAHRVSIQSILESTSGRPSPSLPETPESFALRQYRPSYPLSDSGLSDLYESSPPTQKPTEMRLGTSSEAAHSTSEPGSLATHAKISFILYNHLGVPDFSNPLSSSTFKSLSLAQFFSLYAQRARIPAADLEKLTFIVTFAKHLGFVVHKDDTEQSFRLLKKRIGSLFVLTRERRPREVDFEVWVEHEEGEESDDDIEVEDEEFEGL